MGNLRAVPIGCSIRNSNTVMPASIRIGAMDYEVRRWSVAEAKGAGALGQCDPDGLTIAIRAGLHPLKEAEVLLHEVLHAAYAGAALREFQGKDPEECIVAGLASQLLQIWRENPLFVQYFETVFRPGAVPASQPELQRAAI